MKKARGILWMLFALSLTLLLGVFIGRNHTSHFVAIPTNSDFEDNSTTGVNGDYRLDLNTATKVQLMELPGIGETTAARILDYREQNGRFSSTDELLNVEGIGEKKLLQIEPYIMVGG